MRRGVVLTLIVLAGFLCLATSGQAALFDTKAAIIMNLSTGELLYEQNADTPIPPASLTKVLTMYMAFEAIQRGELHLDDQVSISSEADRTGGSSMGVKVGTQVSVRDLLTGMAVASGNDACVALAEHLGGVDRFVTAMNEKAQALGMNGTRFYNVNGLPHKQQTTTARDMLRLAVDYLQRFPQSLDYHSIQRITLGDVTCINRNRLLGACEGVDGLKTGYVRASGYNLIATAKRGNVRLVAVILGGSTYRVRNNETQKILEAGFLLANHAQPDMERALAQVVPTDAKGKAVEAASGRIDTNQLVVSKSKPKIRSMLKQRVSVAQAERANLVKGVPFGPKHDWWRDFISKMSRSDELWELKQTAKGSKKLREGPNYCIVRNGEIVDSFFSAVN